MPGQWIEDEIFKRLREAGATVSTVFGLPEITRINDTNVKLRIDAVQRWGRPAFNVVWQHFEPTFRTDYYGKIDFDALVAALLDFVQREKPLQDERQRLGRLHNEIVALVKSLGVKIRSNGDGKLRNATITIGDKVTVTIQLPLCRRKEIVGLLEYLLRDKK